MFLLDTNVVSELRKVGDNRADPNVMQWAAAQDSGRFYISALTLMEFEIGVLRIERWDSGQGARLSAWLDERVVFTFADRTLPVDGPVALRCARLRVPNPQSGRDAIIAATALVHGMSMVTRNVRDFEATKVPLVDPSV